MSNKNYPVEFEEVTAKLRQWREQVLVELRSPESHEKALQLKRQIDFAINCLEFCQRHQIRPTQSVLVLPPTQTETWSSNYRISEDHESDNPRDWVELRIDGGPIHLCPGDIIIS